MIREGKMLKKEKFVLIMFALLMSVVSICLLNTASLAKPVFADQTTDGFTLIDSLSDITNMSGKYRLQQSDSSYTYSASLGKFFGVLDGNGCTISFSVAGDGFAETQPLFESLEMGAEVFNITFAPNTAELSQSVYLGAGSSNAQKTAYGVLAGTISNATVYGIQFLNTNAYVYDNPALTSTPELSIGLLAGKIVGQSNVNQIKITNCAILPFVDEDVANGLRPNFNVGILAGKVYDGAYVQNCFVQKSQLHVCVADSQSTEHNMGALVGSVVTGTLTNNIVDCVTTTTPFVSIAFQGADKSLNFGYIAGKTMQADVSLFNNVVDVNQDSMLSLAEEGVSAGLIVGNMATRLSTEDLQGFVTVYDGQFVGNIQNEELLATYANISKIELETLFLTNILDNTIWNNIYYWNFNKVWKSSTTSPLPTLQYFENYSILFSSADSVKSLAIASPPTLADSTQNVVNADFALINSDLALAGTTLSVPYGKAVKLTTSVTNLKNFNKFFKISGLLLNGVKIYDYDYNTQTGTAYNGFEVTGEPNAETGNFDFIISNFTANNAGTYSVQLLRNEFLINIYVHEIIVNEQPIIPGKIKSNMASDGAESLTVAMKYGMKFVYETYDVNSDYAKEADWFLYNSQPNNSEFEYDIDSASTSFVAKSNLEWTFDENCILFGSGNSEDLTDYLTLDDYYYNSDDEQDVNANIFTIAVMFTKDVKDIEVRFKFDDEEEITEKIAEVVIDDGAVSLTYVDGYYKAKIRYSTKTHVISLKGVSTDYTFDGWYLNSRMPQATGDNYGGTFEIINDGDSSTVVIYAVFTKENANDGSNLLWLWLTLGGVGLVLAVVVIVIVVKKKKSEGSSYKKYMY
ncbi:MAG: hypothetical protein IJ318_01920 [Clostridia bacterium]|nr:hypothetical protein [Clostridia bacterium]